MFEAIPSLLVFIALNAAAAFSGAFFRPGAWYKQLDKPPWCPPDWLFGPAWTVLYTTIAVSGWLVWRTGGLEGPAWAALAIYGVQLVLNAGWSAVFFGMQRPGLALLELIVFWLSILATIIAFHGVYPPAAYLLLPYLAWVSFAGVLNYSLWRRNSGRVPSRA